MIRRNTNRNTYEVKTQRGRYAVTLERIRNNANGNTRFSANIIVLSVGDEVNTGYFYTVNYTFSGHYSGDEAEAAFIVNRYESDMKH